MIAAASEPAIRLIGSVSARKTCGEDMRLLGDYRDSMLRVIENLSRIVEQHLKD